MEKKEFDKWLEKQMFEIVRRYKEAYNDDYLELVYFADEENEYIHIIDGKDSNHNISKHIVMDSQREEYY